MFNNPEAEPIEENQEYRNGGCRGDSLRSAPLPSAELHGQDLGKVWDDYFHSPISSTPANGGIENVGEQNNKPFDSVPIPSTAPPADNLIEGARNKNEGHSRLSSPPFKHAVTASMRSGSDNNQGIIKGMTAGQRWTLALAKKSKRATRDWEVE
ncbi:MAG: hypothetical protein KJ072_06060 [Verrucomicrobia bacterium]|nr:hypothetical protein [Verrucomicrobiota bacterium]